VFLALEEGAGRACVVKKVLPRLVGNAQFLARFRDEARVVLRLEHPNIARVWAMGEVEGHLYLAMEYVQGQTLNRLAWRLRQLGRSLPVALALFIGERMCQGLAYAHAVTDEEGHLLHLVHRDLSPANVCVSYGGEVKIIDFGAAQSTLKEAQTAPQIVMGSLAYMAPEQARKQRVDRRADVYATGVVLWELLAWRPLEQQGNAIERWRRAAYPQWEPPSQLQPGLPPEVDAVVMRALATEPEERYPDAAAFGEALRALREALAPQVGEGDLARLMGEVFDREKAAEERALEALLTSGVFEPQAPAPGEEVVTSGSVVPLEEATPPAGVDVSLQLDITEVREEGEPTPVAAPAPAGRGWWWAAGLFLAAGAAGFLVVWMLIR
jgi:serine/threonine-protein kinase